MTFSARMAQEILRKKSPVLVGLDPRWNSLPEILRRNVDETDLPAVAEVFRTFSCRILDVVAPHVACVKPQLAFFEAIGPAGTLVLAEVIQYARKKGLLVILDGKRNDIGSTAAGYATAYLGKDSPWGGDALTVSPYLGEDSLQPFVDAAEKREAGIFVLVKTSNPGGGMLQDLSVDGKTIYQRVADWVEEKSASHAAIHNENYGCVGAVVGATYPEQLAQLRERMPHTWFLVPGFGAQGGTADDVMAAFDANGLGAIINSSRGIIFAHARKDFAGKFADADWEKAVEAATLEMVAQFQEMYT
ncbi:MAG: orotidine-5'-phosphate decarboxylase [Planctomycetia bacterium]|nr:orotidine-5'-phosphate decarboxylase [Planctomycetia bacterium]